MLLLFVTPGAFRRAASGLPPLFDAKHSGQIVALGFGRSLNQQFDKESKNET